MTDKRNKELIEAVKDFWHIIEPQNQGSREFLRDLHKGVNALLIQHSALGSEQTILDISNDLGESLRTAIKQVGGKSFIVGVDPIHSALLGIRNQLSSGNMAKFVCAEVDQLPFPSQCFDRVISRFGLNFTRDPDRCLKSINDLLMPEGILTLVTFERPSPKSLVDILLGVLQKKFSNISPVYLRNLYRFSDYNKLRVSLENAHFRGIRSFPRTITRHLSVSSSAWIVEAALFFGHYYVALSKQEKIEVIDELRGLLEPYRRDENYVLEDHLRIITCMR